jgi:hypothetical protein
MTNAETDLSAMHMIRVILWASVILAFGQAAPADAAEPRSGQSVPAGTQQEEAAQLLAEVQTAVQMARKGDYGPLKKDQLRQLQTAQEEIEGLLAGRTQLKELSEQGRVALFNAQQTITAILRSDEKDRKICKREVVIGSRLNRNVCLTVAEREARAKAAKAAMVDMRRQ